MVRGAIRRVISLGPRRYPICVGPRRYPICVGPRRYPIPAYVRARGDIRHIRVLRRKPIPAWALAQCVLNNNTRYHIHLAHGIDYRALAYNLYDGSRLLGEVQSSSTEELQKPKVVTCAVTRVHPRGGCFRDSTYARWQSIATMGR